MFPLICVTACDHWVLGMALRPLHPALQPGTLEDMVVIDKEERA